MAKKRAQDDIIGYIAPNIARRGFAVLCLGGLSFLLIMIAATNPPQHLFWLLVLIVFGIAALVVAYKLWEASSRKLILTQEYLREENGRILFHIDNVDNVDRGFFAMKPAGGFVVFLHKPEEGGRVYAPGLWRRWGRSVSVGGVTSPGEAKAVADLIKIILAERDLGAKPKN